MSNILLLGLLGLLVVVVAVLHMVGAEWQDRRRRAVQPPLRIPRQRSPR